MVVAVPTAATAPRKAYWMRVAKIWSGTPNATPSARARAPTAAISGHRVVRSVQTVTMASRRIRIRCGPLAASQAAITPCAQHVSRRLVLTAGADGSGQAVEWGDGDLEVHADVSDALR
jgi:hypothetical protein